MLYGSVVVCRKVSTRDFISYEFGLEQTRNSPTDRCVGLPAEEEVASGYLQRRSTARSGPVAGVAIFPTGVSPFPVYLGSRIIHIKGQEVAAVFRPVQQFGVRAKRQKRVELVAGHSSNTACGFLTHE